MRARLTSIRRGALVRQDGSTLIELLIAMVILEIGIFAVFTMFSSSILAITRASTVSTTSALADTEIEKFRAATYGVLGLTSAAVTGTDALYKSDGAYKAPGSNLVNQAVTLGASTFVPTRTLTAADGITYRVDVYITWEATQGAGSVTGRNQKRVTVVVRKPADANKVWSRVSSSFDLSTGS